MLKKLTSLLLSLLICLSLLPGQAGAADVPENEPAVQTEASEAARLDDPDELVMPAAEFPEKDATEKVRE